jgi:hypothetical protein
MDNKAIGTFTIEEDAFALVRSEARKHREAEFRVEKTETVFDSVREPRDKQSLQRIRSPRKTNAIHGSIHPEDWKVGWEDGE